MSTLFDPNESRMEGTWARAASKPLKQAYTKLFKSATPLSRIRDAALADRLFTSERPILEVPGRSLAWKLFLLPDEPLQPSPEVDATPPLPSLRASRKKYANLLMERMRAPDGSYEEGFVVPGSSISPERPGASASNLETNNPLSLHNENPWKEWFAAVELRKTILQDVERTFPEIAFFRETEVQLQLTNILFLYSTVTNPAIGYRQGMHELLAPLYYAVDYDSTEESAEVDDPAMQEFCSRTWVAADSWALFETLMRGASRWYEWQETPSASKANSSPFATHVNIAAGPVEIKPYITPVVEDCNRIQSQLLRTTDPLLWKHMQAAGIEPQIYGIRWLRLLYTREFDMPSAMKLWDGLFACDPTFELAPWICVAMLIRIRNELIPSDYSGQLTSLLRYPSHPTAEGPHHTSVLLRQALTLQMSPNQATGHFLVVENRNILNIPMEVPEPPPPPQRRGPRTRDKAPAVPGAKPGVEPRQQPAPQLGLEIFARGLLERGENLGINKTLMSAVPEIRRNLSELAASFVRSPSAPSFPMNDERLPEERPPWEPKSRLEIEREIAALQVANRRLGQSLGWAVDVLLQDEGEAKDLARLKSSKREALEAISYVRDMLTSNQTEIEEERLFGEEELAKRRAAKERPKRSPNNSIDVPQPVAPTPVPVIDSRRPTMTHSPPASITSSFSAPPAPTKSALPPTSPSANLAPWHYTRSNFSAGSLPSASLPRIPPPTSATIQRPPETSREVPRPPPAPRRAQSKTEHDPLGVL
ncbi:rab-GTPase-TBC domain-containing protein [Mycena maculata]|uniref:Rab-GTPase-TBC domain-containing protein n=1 Tax=Mycena maculata TaxID=230809 RepID=A0AAD7IDL1_9AGAR|nr:rab-GTPase-TBC domain-containing protein [Mycena maculata]